MAYVGDHDNQVSLKDNQVPPLEEVSIGDQVQIVAPAITNGEIMVEFLNFSQSMTFISNALSSHVQSMTSQMNRRLDIECLNIQILWPLG